LEHQQQVFETFANVLDKGHRLPEHTIALPSAFNEDLYQLTCFSYFAKAELEIRVGHGHDILDRIRKAIGLKTFLFRWHKTEVRGLAESQKVSSARTRAKVNLDHFVNQYKRNWIAITKIIQGLALHLNSDLECIEVLKGLQKIESDDLRMLSDWVDDTPDYHPNRWESMPWIWKVGRYESAEVNQSEVKTIVEEWEEEGTIFAVSGVVC